ATKNPDTAPVVLWLTGGPGCSSLLAMFTENGPFRVGTDGQTVGTRDYSWNTVANVLYLESPAGTGFSYDENNNYTNNDETTSLDNYLSIESFFVKYPHLKGNPFYITGESYAGIYIPMLAKQIYRHNSTINLKGMAIGNGALANDRDTNFGQAAYDFALGHGLITTEDYERKIENCCDCKVGAVQRQCDFTNPDNKTKCDSVKIDYLTSQLPNPYNIYDNCAPDLNNQQIFNEYYRPMFDKIGLRFGNFKLRENPPECNKYGHTVYLNTGAVRKALHVREGLKPWSECNGADHYNRTGFAPQLQNVKDLIRTYKMSRFIAYNGNFDSLAVFMGGQRFVSELGFQTTSPYKKWTVDGTPDGVIGGFIQEYERGLSFVVVRGAGHMVPEDKPEADI
ncbi:unnamed protein product, partial [Oppiella nova]